MKSKESRIFRSSDRTGRDYDGRRERERCFGLANPNGSQGCAKVLRIGKLLSPIH